MSTPNILLTTSTPLVTAGPTWASNVEANWLLLDAHDHSAGKGLKVTPAGLNINATLPFNSYDATQLRTTKYDSQGTSLASTDQNAVYVVAGNLYFNNGTGGAIQITSGTSLNVSGVGGITGLGGTTGAVTYSDITKTFSFTQNAGITASMDHGPITIRENIAAAQGITIQSPASLAGSYSLTLPTVLPGSTQPLSVSSAGVLSASQILAAQIVSNIALNGNVSATGTLTATTGLIATAGGLTVTAGGITVTSGATVLGANNLTQTTGTITQSNAASFVDTQGYVQANSDFRHSASGARIAAQDSKTVAIRDSAGANPRSVVVSGDTSPNPGLLIARATVDAAGTVLQGTGLSVVRNSVGNYTATFTSAFTNAPTILLTIGADLPRFTIVNVGAAMNTVNYKIYDAAGAVADAVHEILAIGSRNV